MGDVRYIDTLRGRGGFEGASLPRRPNVVFITIDMVPADFYRAGEANSGLVRTPAIDSLRSECAAFTNAFATSPLCGPSRAAYLTGRYPYLLVNEERAHDGWEVALRDDDIIFPEYLKAAGYVTKHVGKSHVGTQKFVDAFGEADDAWNRWAPPMTDDDGYVAHLKRLGVTPPVYDNPVRGVRQDRKTPGNNYGGFLRQQDGAAFPEEATYPHYLAALAMDRIDAAIAQGAGKTRPLYLQVDFFAPHQPFMIPGGYEERAAALRAKVTLPQSFYAAQDHDFGSLPGEPRIYGFYRRDTGIFDEETMREYIVMNILQMEVLDAAIGKVFVALRERGLWDDSLVILAGDHGEMNGEKALVDKGAYAHPRVARTPLLVKTPGASAASDIDTPVSLLDIAPTVLKTAGISPQGRLDGVSLLPLLPDDKSASADMENRVLLFEACWHVAPNPAVAIPCRDTRGNRYWYVYNLTSDFDELYDLSDATYTNLAADPAHADVKNTIIRSLGEFLKADPRWRCYWHTMRLDKEAVLPPDEGDYQMFQPE